MKVKFDKDMILKHRFWVLLAVSVPLIMVAIFVLITKVSADIQAAHKKAEDAEKKVKAVSNPPGPNRIQALNEVAAKRKAAEVEVHRIAFDVQKKLFTWPKAIEDKYDFQYGLFATEIKIQGKDAGDNPPDDETFYGAVTENDEDYVIVKGKDKNEKAVELKFYRTFGMKVSRAEGSGAAPQFGTIQIGDKLAVTYYKSRYFYDQLTDNEQRLFVREYKTQIHPILQLVDPVDAEGNGTVQFNGWPYSRNEMPPAKARFFTYVAEDWNDAGFIFDEAWLAQEDLWVQYELFRIIREANDSVARFEWKQPVMNDKRKPIFVNPTATDKAKPAVFVNPYFELKFDWDGVRLFVTVKNQLQRRQKLDVHFRIRFNEANNRFNSTEKVLVGDEPLEAMGDKNDTRRIEIAIDSAGIKRTGIYEVEQVLNWETAPVKRIDATSVGWIAGDIAHGHRTFTSGSQPYRKDEKKDDLAAGGPMGPMGLPGGPPPGEGRGGFPGGGFPGGFGGLGQGPPVNLGVNGLLKDRYLEVSDQSRRIPVGMSLIVDQDHVDRVLTAFNNSKLRFLTTQVLLNRYPNSIRPLLAGATGSMPGTGGPEGGAPQYIPMGYEGGRGGREGPMSIGPGAVPPGMPGAYGPGGTPGGGEELENNVEMVIYGIVTLYERYPKRKIQATDVSAAK